MTRHLFLLALLAAVAAPSRAATPLDKVIRLSLAESYVTAILLNGGDAVRFGFWDFDPNNFIGLEDENLGSLEAQQLRQRLSTLSIPYTWSTPLGEDSNTLVLGVKAAYLGQRQETQIVSSDMSTVDAIDSSITTLTLGGEVRHRLNGYVGLAAGLNLNWQRYRNRTDFNTPESQALAPLFDGLITNYSANAWQAEPHVRATWFVGGRDAELKLISSLHYMHGRTFDTGETAHDVQPEAWYWSNSARWRHPYVTQILPGQNVWLQASRYDLGGDLDGPLGNHYYYEAGVGWLLDIRKMNIPFVDNVGIGINLNYGSALRGGTLVLLFNEE
ncbi:Solitary outer membrane autotransporter beta-barrel domain [Alcanivorax sp. DP30]|uniref:Solitary outer membrane autotransporter beta-barrel domain n=1 Tax=Alcanivorax sp. DP30 TaxID=2606217 RepID=UPI00136C1F62|nr:Solitary outer membrane autotransporter beta-barrel domain [Alcanivorax sp. DP30]MZR62667.1 Solitary outer membrane autotransporter beta-barrel domain [Alcanivorax sp. DP30]